MSMSDDLDIKLDKILNSLRQNRYKLEQLLITIQSQQQAILDSLQQITAGSLQHRGYFRLISFEEKAGAAQGIQGIFYGNPLLKNEIMQKRVALEQNLQKLREMGYQLQQKIQLLGKSVQDVGRYVLPEIAHEEKSIEEIMDYLAENSHVAKVLVEK